MEFKCKMCGGSVTVDHKNGVMICDFCGTKQALPLFTEDSARLLYERGNNYLHQSEYDKASAMFNQLLAIMPNDPELYWDLVLCKYGVTYVKDPKTEKYVPTCNRTHYTTIFNDENYIKAIELSTGEKNSLYKADAQIIDNIQKGIIAVSKKEKPFDIFISYKESDSNGNRTKDSIEAQKLYEKLTEAGYKVFFSRITLEDKAGTEYEPYIYAALYSSKVMITVSSSKENIEGVWVKNEWSRFLQLSQNQDSKTLIPTYFNMTKQELPDEFALIPGYDIKAEGFEQELLRGIKKLIPLPIMLAKKRKKMMKIASITASVVCSIAVVATAVCVPIYIKAKKNQKAYSEATVLFENAKYKEASKAFAALEDYKDSPQMVKNCEIQPEYDKAKKLYSEGNFAEATFAFAKLKDYKDAKKQRALAERSWRVCLSEIVADNFSGSIYYISENGTVDCMKDAMGNQHSKIDVSQNGKVVSILLNSMYDGYDKYIIALHENGVVANPEMTEIFAKNPEWHNIIKCTNLMQGFGMVSLRNDGKIVAVSYDDKKPSAFEQMASWENIVDFKYGNISGNGYCNDFLVGLKADGSLCAVEISNFPDGEGDVYGVTIGQVNEILQKFSNVKSFAFNNDYTNGFSIIALTKDHKLLKYVNDEFTEKSDSDLCSIASMDIALKSNGDLVYLDNGKTLARDVVYAEDGAAVTRSGNLVFISAEGVVSDMWQYYADVTDAKTTVYDDWITRLN